MVFLLHFLYLRLTTGLYAFVIEIFLMKLAFNSLISSTGTFASLLKDTFFVDNLLKNRAKPIRLACHT